MSCFLLSKGLCQTLAGAVAKFWWSSKQHSQRMHWIAWKKLCLPKKEDDISFKSFEDFNKGLLAEKLWRIHQYPNTLDAQVLKRRPVESLTPSHRTAWPALGHAKPYSKRHYCSLFVTYSKEWQLWWHHRRSGPFFTEIMRIDSTQGFITQFRPYLPKTGEE